jgi:hypothetical protein
MKLCECGCGLPTSISKCNRANRGHIKGKPTRFRAGHNPHGGETKGRRIAVCKRGHRRSSVGLYANRCCKQCNHITYIARAFGITVEEYNARLAKQKNKCALCGEKFYGAGHNLGMPALDHNPCSGKLREFIHKRCNAALGLFEDNAEVCRAAARYLNKHN